MDTKTSKMETKAGKMETKTTADKMEGTIKIDTEIVRWNC